MKKRKGCNKAPAIIIAVGAALLCLSFLSLKALLIIVAIVLIILGIWLMKCC